MPQMKPMNWLLLWMYTILLLMFTNNMLNYFNYKIFNGNYNKNNNFKLYKKFNYKW